MKMKIAALSVALCAAAAVAAHAQGQTTDIRADKGDPAAKGKKSASTWKHKLTEDGHELEITLRKQVEFSDDFTEIVRVSEGGYFEVRERSGGTVRWFEATPDGQGGVRRRYTLNGERREFDGEARAWLTKVLVAAVRNGLYAQETAARLLRERGAGAVLDEAANLTSDYARSIFYAAVFEQRNLDTRTLTRALRLAQQLTSDYERSKLLVTASKFDLGDDGVRSAFFAAFGRMESDYERDRVLQSAAEEHKGSAEVLLRVVAAARGISSDYYKANVLVKVAGLSAAGGAVRAALLDAAQGISSDYYRQQVLAAVGERRG